MDLIKYNGKRTDPVFLEKHEEFRREYNSAISQYSFDSNEARELNREIFAAIYYAACEKSMEIAKSRLNHRPY